MKRDKVKDVLSSFRHNHENDMNIFKMNIFEYVWFVGFGNEIYLYPEQAKQLKQINIYKRDTAKAIERRMHAMIPHTEEELYKLWKSVHIIN